MSSGLLRMFVELGKRGSPVLIPLAITGWKVKHFCIVTHFQSGLNWQPPDDCLLRSFREPTPETVTLYVLRDSSEWIFGTYKLNVLTWLEWLLLCIIFYLCSYSDRTFDGNDTTSTWYLPIGTDGERESQGTLFYQFDLMNMIMMIYAFVLYTNHF